LLVIVVGLAFAGYRTYNHVEHDPNFCASCHLMQTAYMTWKQGPYNKLDCHMCHQQDIQDRTRIVWRWAISDVKNVPPHASLNRKVCPAPFRTEGPDPMHHLSQTSQLEAGAESTTKKRELKGERYEEQNQSNACWTFACVLERFRGSRGRR